MNQSDLIDHDEHRAQRADIAREQAAELAAQTTEAPTIMRLTITINLDGAAFRDEDDNLDPDATADQLRQMFAKVANQADCDQLDEGGVLRDSNGNKVGTFEVTGD